MSSKKISTLYQHLNNENSYQIRIIYSTMYGSASISYDGSVVVDELLYNYSDYKFFYRDQPEVTLQKLFGNFIKMHDFDLKQLANALLGKYNPLHNYDSDEQSTTTDTTTNNLTDINTHKVDSDRTEFVKEVDLKRKAEITSNDLTITTEKTTDTEVYSHDRHDVETPNLTITNNNTSETNTYTTTFDDLNPRMNNRQTTNSNDTQNTKGSTTDSSHIDDTKDTTKGDSVRGVKSINKDSDTTDTMKKTGSVSNSSSFHLTRKGNIGVMTTQSMINEEIKLRKKNLLKVILDMFKDDYLFLVESEEF